MGSGRTREREPRATLSAMRMQLADLSPAAFPQDGFTFDRVFGMETMQEHIYSYGIQETVQGVCLASLLARTA